TCKNGGPPRRNSIDSDRRIVVGVDPQGSDQRLRRPALRNDGDGIAQMAINLFGFIRLQTHLVVGGIKPVLFQRARLAEGFFLLQKPDEAELANHLRTALRQNAIASALAAAEGGLDSDFGGGVRLVLSPVN